MKKRRFLVGIVLGSIAGYVASKYLVSEDGQRALENIKTIRGDFNNGGFGLANKEELKREFDSKTDSLKKSFSNKTNDLKDDEETTNIVFDEDDINKDNK